MMAKSDDTNLPAGRMCAGCGTAIDQTASGNTSLEAVIEHFEENQECWETARIRNGLPP